MLWETIQKRKMSTVGGLLGGWKAKPVSGKPRAGWAVWRKKARGHVVSRDTFALVGMNVVCYGLCGLVVCGEDVDVKEKGWKRGGKGGGGSRV